MRDVAVQLHDRATRSDLAVGLGEHAGEMELEAVAERGVLREQAVDRLHEMDMRTREDVEPRDAAAEHAA